MKNNYSFDGKNVQSLVCLRMSGLSILEHITQQLECLDYPELQNSRDDYDLFDRIAFDQTP
jgi:hypothetical protein